VGTKPLGGVSLMEVAMKLGERQLAGLLFVAHASACMSSPYSGMSSGNIKDPVYFELFATQPSATITIECGAIPWLDYTKVGTVTADASPYVTKHGDSVYRATLTTQLPGECWDATYPHKVGGKCYLDAWTHIRPTQDTWPMRVFDQDGLSCVTSKVVLDNESPLIAGQNCALKDDSGQPKTEVVVWALMDYPGTCPPH
jgi:hypothetical protein